MQCGYWEIINHYVWYGDRHSERSRKTRQVITALRRETRRQSVNGRAIFDTSMLLRTKRRACLHYALNHVCCTRLQLIIASAARRSGRQHYCIHADRFERRRKITSISDGTIEVACYGALGHELCPLDFQQFIFFITHIFYSPKSVAINLNIYKVR